MRSHTFKDKDSSDNEDNY